MVLGQVGRRSIEGLEGRWGVVIDWAHDAPIAAMFKPFHDLAMSAERVFAGTYITEIEVREKALAWVPEVMRFVSAAPEAGDPEIDATEVDPGVDGEIHTPRELAA